MFLSSKTIAEHLLRGTVGVGALWYAIHIGDHHPLLSLALGVLALFALKGCPICWIMGLIATLRQRFTRKPSDDTTASH